MDYPDDAATWAVDDQYLMGDSVLVAPVVAGQRSRNVYLPAGDWYDFWTGKKHDGKQRIPLEVPLEQIPLFVKGGSILPLAEATLHTGDPNGRNIDVRVYGDGARRPRWSRTIGKTRSVFKGEFNRVSLNWNVGEGKGATARSGTANVPRYNIREWRQV